MISYLSGTLHTKLPDSIILLTESVGYRVFVSPTTYSQLVPSASLNLFIHTHVREDALDLYGFKTVEELSLFEMLLNVSGIGPKTALLVIDRGVEPVKKAIARAEVSFFTLIPRLGQKNSQKIIIELKNKLGSLVDLDLSSESPEILEAAEALQSIGFSKKEALLSLKGVNINASIEEKIKYALKNTGKRKT